MQRALWTLYFLVQFTYRNSNTFKTVCLPIVLPFSVVDGVPTYITDQHFSLTNPIYRIQFINKPQDFSHQKDLWI